MKLPPTAFPDPARAPVDGPLARGGELTPERLLDAYRHGIFPWFENDRDPVLWWSPDPRAVLAPDQLRISKSLRKRLKSGRFRVTADRAFAEVVAGCAAPRAKHPGTWITPRVARGYRALFELGFAHSVETWRDDELVGGLYGVSLGRMFFGESMFSRQPDASKVALAHLTRQLVRWGFALIDCQITNDHLESLGAMFVERRDFLRLVHANNQAPTLRGPWRLDAVDWR